MKRRSVSFGFSLAVVLFVLHPANAQSTFGTILGSVKDPSGGAVVGAKITVTNEGTNIAKETSTDGLGNYEVTHLNPAVYTVTAEFAGFQKHIHQHVTLQTSQVLRIDIPMKVGEVTQALTVTGEAPVVESETSTISGVQTGHLMRELPISFFAREQTFSGGIYRYVSLAPGSFRLEGTGANHMSGAKSNQINWLADGLSLGDQGGNNISSSQPSFEGIQEMRVVQVNNSAEFGNVATVSVITKSGTNQIHGSGFEQYNDAGLLNARNFFQSTVPFRIYNGFGGSLGGPVVLPGYDGRNRTFFFSAFEASPDHNRTLYNANVPSLAVRGGDFSQVRNADGSLIVIRDPTNGQPFTGNAIPGSKISTQAAKIQERFYPAPNFGSPTSLNQNYRASVPQVKNGYLLDVRIDHRLNAKNSFYGRWTWRNLPVEFPTGALPTIPRVPQKRRIRNLTVVDTHIISPRTINELRAGFSWHENRVDQTFQGLQLVQELGIAGLTITNPDLRGTPAISITGFTAGLSQFGASRSRDMVYEFVDAVTFITARHSLKVGFNLRRNYASRYTLPNTAFGSFSFTGAFSGFAYADFLLGLPQSTARTTPAEPTYGYNISYAGYVQDDIKVHPNLTLNVGLRYEWMNPYADKYDRMYNFDPGTGSLVVPTQTVLGRDVSPLFPSGITIVTADRAGFPRRGLRVADGNNFDPRFGLAWRPFGHARSVFRGGFGVYRNTLASGTFTTLSGGGPFISNESFTNSVVNGVPLLTFAMPFLAVGSLGAQSVNGVVPNLFNPYTMQWNLTAAQEYASIAFRASYIGTRSVNLRYGRNVNQPPASTVPFSNTRRPYPQYNNITVTQNGASSIYHALQLEAEKKFERGLYFQAGWTWAKQLDEANATGDGEGGASIENTYNRAVERGDHLYLSRHRFVVTHIWDLPFGPGRRWLSASRGVPGHILGGWEFSGSTVLRTGQRFTPSFSGRDVSNTNTLSGRPDRIANGNLPSSERTLTRWFDASAFVVPPVNVGRFGNAGVGILEGPGTIAVSLGLHKNFRLREGFRLQFSVLSLNTINHPNFVNPAANIAAPTTVGSISGMQGVDGAAPRIVILSGRIDF